MLFQPLRSLYLTFSLAAAGGIVRGAIVPRSNASTDATMYEDSQIVTVQRFPLKQDTYGGTGDILNQLTEATSNFKATSGSKVEHAYLGVVNGNPNTAEQIFLWRNLDVSDVSSIDTTRPFIPFSATGLVNVSTALLSNRTTLLRSLNYPVIESVVFDILPDLSTSQVMADYSAVIDTINESGLGLGGSHGLQAEGDRRTFVAVNGWQSFKAPNTWKSSLSSEMLVVYTRLQNSFVGGLATPLFKHLDEVQ
ncbi:hypothetical protein L218DRAFT_944320 [Marasmius fiardii PR-910]|nr:hypothetical protein L218DRAFT_944320 [Marasmius fiardii PR-910]